MYAFVGLHRLFGCKTIFVLMSICRCSMCQEMRGHILLVKKDMGMGMECVHMTSYTCQISILFVTRLSYDTQRFLFVIV